MDETLNIILDTDQPIQKKTTLSKIINKINELFSKEEPEQINKKKNKHHIEELFGYTYNTITTDNSIDKTEKQLKPKFRKKKKRRR